MEIDISEKVNRAIQIGLIAIFLLTALASAGVWWWQKDSAYMLLGNATVMGDMVNASVKASGTVTEILVHEGDEVKAGDVVAKLQVKSSPEQIKQLEDALEKAKARLQEILANSRIPAASAERRIGGDTAAAQAALDRAAKDKEKMDGLFAIGAVSAVQQRQATAAYQAALSDLQAARQAASKTAQAGGGEDNGGLLRIAELQVKQAELALSSSKKALQAAEITAPVDGTVSLTEVKAGDAVEAGQIILRVGDANTLWIEALVRPDRIGRIRLGQFVEYTIDGYPGKALKGTVFEITESAEEPAAASEGEKPRKDGIPVKISLPANPDAAIKPGMRVQIKVSI